MANSCDITLSTIAQDCRPNLSGIKKIAVANYVEGAFSKDDANPNMVTLEHTEVKWTVYIPAKNTGSLTKTLTKNEQTGVLYYTNEVAATFNHMDGDNGAAVDLLGQGRLMVVVQDKNEMNWVLGVDDWVSVSGITGQTGAAADDGNNWQITFTEVSSHAAYNTATFVWDPVSSAGGNGQKP